MNRPPDNDAPATPEEMIQDYLDFLCAPLAGTVPFRERHQLREDALFVIERSVNDFLLEGLSEQAATLKAIERYGESREVGQQVVACWFRHQPQGWLARRIGLGNAVALLCFGQATLWSLLLIQWRIYQPDGTPLWFAGLSPAQIRLLIPEPLPLPEGGATLYLLFALLFVAPILAGAIVGAKVPVRPSQAVWGALAPLNLVCFLMGFLMLPTVEGLFLAVAQMLWWLPVGSLTAHVVAILTWRRNCRFHPG